MRSILAIAFVLLAGTLASAHDKDLIDALQKLDVRVLRPDSADAKLRSDALRELRDHVNKKDVEAWSGIKAKADWETFRAVHLAKLRSSLGEFPSVPKKVKVVVTKKLQGDGFTVENIIYQSRPGLYVTRRSHRRQTLRLGRSAPLLE